jgi:hypothetical protein
LKQPSIEEQYDVLLKEFMGHSLKENAALWQSFMTLKTARNKYVHEGVATIGGVPVTIDEALSLLRQVFAISEWIRDRLPADLQWQKFEIPTQIEAYKTLIQTAPSQEELAIGTGGASVQKSGDSAPTSDQPPQSATSSVETASAGSNPPHSK